MRRAMVLLGGVALAIGAFVLFYRGPGQPFIRSYVSDVGATMLVYAFLGLLWCTTAARRTLATAAIAAAVEFYQIVGMTPPGIGDEIKRREAWLDRPWRGHRDGAERTVTPCFIWSGLISDESSLRSSVLACRRHGTPPRSPT